jgi:hypothetical protein
MLIDVDQSHHVSLLLATPVFTSIGDSLRSHLRNIREKSRNEFMENSTVKIVVCDVDDSNEASSADKTSKLHEMFR